MGIQSIFIFIILILLFFFGYIIYKNYKTCKFSPSCYWNAAKKKWKDLKSGNFKF